LHIDVDKATENQQTYDVKRCVLLEEAKWQIVDIPIAQGDQLSQKRKIRGPKKASMGSNNQ
jgi:hypothetical protein